MGALHEGHRTLIRRSKAENQLTVVSIFVNPTQFNDKNDFANYPKTIEQDSKILEEEGVDFLLLPKAEDIYKDQYTFKISENDLSTKFCGEFRPGHFDGVLTVVMKLFMLAKPHRAYFGEKDYQQLKLIEKMVDAFYLPLEIIACPSVREIDGLAMSSRNVRLDQTSREKAPMLAQTLAHSPTSQSAREELQKLGFKVDYVEDWEGRRLAAAYLGPVRLIDNVEIMK
jgi:pantoate--beta-alanine ligase